MFFDPFMKHHQISCLSLDLQLEPEMSPAAEKDASDNSSSEEVIANNMLPEMENDDDIDVKDEGDIDFVTQRSQPPKPSTLP